MGEEAEEVEHGEQAQHPGHQYEADHERDGPAEHERERRAEQQRRHPGRRHLRQPRRPPGHRRGSRDIDDVVDERGELLHDPSLVAHHNFFHLQPIQHYQEKRANKENIYIIIMRLKEWSMGRGKIDLFILIENWVWIREEGLVGICVGEGGRRRR